MISLNCFPDLILHCILTHTIDDETNFNSALDYLAVCQSFRHAALPLVYKEAYVCGYYHNSELLWDTNIDLFLSIGYSSLAKRLDVSYCLGDKHAAGNLEPFLNTLSMEPVQWPVDYQQKLVPLDDHGSYIIMNEELLEIVADVVSNFAQKFYRIMDMKLSSSYKSDIYRQINAKLVNYFANRLRALNTNCLDSNSLTCSLDSLTFLDYTFNSASVSLLSKMSILLLEKLHLSGIPKNFSWRFFQKDSGSNEPVVFPNLKDLLLDTVSCTYGGGNPDETVSDGSGRVHFPKLRKLDFTAWSNGFAFKPELIPSHLDTVDLRITGDTLVAFGKLPINSIDFLDVYTTNEPRNMSDFRISGNHLFKGIKNSGKTKAEFGYINLDDVKEMDWPNITHMGFDGISADGLADTLEYMPQIRIAEVNSLICYERDRLSNLNLYGSMLEKLTISETDDDGTEFVVSYILKMISCFEHLREFNIAKHIGIEVEEKVKGLAEDYPQFKDLKINFL